MNRIVAGVKWNKFHLDNTSTPNFNIQKRGIYLPQELYSLQDTMLIYLLHVRVNRLTFCFMYNSPQIAEKELVSDRTRNNNDVRRGWTIKKKQA